MRRFSAQFLGIFCIWSLTSTAFAGLPVVPLSMPPHPLHAVAVSDSQIKLSWPRRFTHVDTFQIERSTDGHPFIQIAQLPATAQTFTDEGLLPGTAYDYRLCGRNAAGDSVWSKLAHARTRGNRPHLSLTFWGNTVGEPPAKLDDLVAVAAGARHQMALQRNGKVTVWGVEYATNGEVKFPKDLKNVAAIAAGNTHCLALKSNGEVVAWGNNEFQQSTPPANLKNVVAIAAGGNHSLALNRDGTVVGWGDNTYGQCLPPTNLNHVVAIAAGGDHSVALRDDGTVAAWGQMWWRPRQDWTNVVAIAAGVNHDLLLCRDGTVEAWISFWGWQEMWNLPPFGLTNVVAIAAGDSLNLALKADGTVVGWGNNHTGALPVPEGMSKVAFIAAGANASLTLSVLPAPPLQFTARATATNRVVLTWVDNCTDEDSYIVERAPNDFWNPGEWTRIATLRANSTRFNDTSVSPAAIYWYRVRAHNRWGTSAATPATTQQLGMLPPPIPDYPFAIIGTSNRVNLQWNNYVWLAGIPDGFEVQRAPDMDGSPGAWMDVGSVRNLNAPTVLFSDAQVAPLKTYWYRVRSYNVFGFSEYATAISITLAPPAEPFPLNANPFADRINLTCYRGDAVASGIDSFQIEKAPDLAGQPGVWMPLTTIPVKTPPQWNYAYADSNLTLHATWWYRVRSHNWIGYSTYSAPVSATVVLPAQPLWLAGWLGASNRVNLRWEQHPPDETGFRIERALDAGGAPGTWNEISTLQLTNNANATFTDFHATALTTNWYRVRAFNVLGNSDYSTATRVAVIPPPAPQLNVSATRDRFDLSFSLADYQFDTGNLDGYKIERAPDAGGSPGNWTQIAQTSEESYTDPGYGLNATRWYRVRASNWTGDGAYSPAVSATIPLPGAPEQLIARIGTTNRIELSWIDGHYDQNGFRLERATDAGGLPGTWAEIAVIPATNIYYGNFTDSNVVALTTNWYRVRAFNEVGFSSFTEPARIAVTPPPAPDDRSYTFVNRDWVTFFIAGNYQSYGLIDGFKIERAPDINGEPGTWAEIGQSSPTDEYNYYWVFSDIRAFANTTWWYRARAYNWIGDSQPGPVVSATIRPPTTPYQIYGRISASNQVDLSWYVPEADEDGFQLERAPDNGGLPGAWTEIAVIPATNTWWGNYTDTNLTGLTTNWYRVRTFNVVGSSDYSIPAAIPLLPPRAPYTAWASPNRDQIIVNWSANYGDYGYVAGFKIERAPDFGGVPGDWNEIGTLAITNPYASDFAFADSGRGLNTTWWYRVRAFNWTGDGEYSPFVSATIIPPAAPEWLAGKIGSTNEVILSWYQSQNDVDGFRIERAPDDGGMPGVWIEIGTSAATNANYAEFTDTNATALTTNWYRVRAFNLFGDSEYGEPALVEVVPPPPPYYVYAQPYRDQIHLSWYADYGEYGTNNGFKIERAPDVSGEPGTWVQVGQVGQNNNSYSDSNLVLNATWWYRVRAYNWVGTGDTSQETYTTILPPGAPDWIVGRIGTTNQVKLSWHDSGVDEDGFRLERAPDNAGLPGAWTEIAILAVTNVSDIEFTDTNAVALTTYWYRVKAFNALGESDYTTSAATTISPPPAPYLSASVYRDQVNLYGYNLNVENYGHVDGLQLERAPDVAGTPGAWSQIATEVFNGPYDNYINYTDPARPVNIKFWYRLCAFNWVGKSDYSPAVSATTVPPATPNYLYGSLGSTNQVNLSWYDFSQDEDGFQLERAQDTNGIPGAWEEIANIPDTNFYYVNYTDTNVMAYTTNWYRVRAYSVLRNSEYCTAISVKAMPPAAPTLINTLYYGPANLYWSPNDPAQGSELERATNTAAGPEAWTSVIRYNILCASYYNDTNIVAGGSYAYRAKAFNWVGDSSWSPVVVITIPNATPALTSITAAAAVSSSTPALRITSLVLTNQDVLITWEALGGGTNMVQAAADLAEGFSDISPPLTITGSGIVATNFLDAGALTNATRRFYRIKGN